jgi:trehalose 6-phosphate phosphatase
MARRLAGTPLVVLLDVDGTLAPIAPRPEDAAVPAETRRVVAALAAREEIHVGLVSGRAAADARRLVAVDNVHAIGNHGCEVVSPEGAMTIDPAVAPWRDALAGAAQALAPRLAEVEGVFLEDKTWTLSIHYRLADPDILPRLRGVVTDVAARYGLPVTEGKKVLEVRPPVSVDKGTAVLALAERLGATGDDASLLYAGDDRTDEDAFRRLRERLPRAVTVRVAGRGGGERGEKDRADDARPDTHAEFVVRDPAEMRELLEWLAAVRRA